MSGHNARGHGGHSVPAFYDTHLELSFTEQCKQGLFLLKMKNLAPSLKSGAFF